MKVVALETVTLPGPLFLTAGTVFEDTDRIVVRRPHLFAPLDEVEGKSKPAVEKKPIIPIETIDPDFGDDEDETED